MKIRLVTRVVTYDLDSKKILLVKNRGQDFWYPPGGSWDYDKESIVECAEREVLEETGLGVKIVKFWLANPIENTMVDEFHVDHVVDGKVEAAKWFAERELQIVKVYPKRLKDTFWQNVGRFLQEQEDPFIGVS